MSVVDVLDQLRWGGTRLRLSDDELNFVRTKDFDSGVEVEGDEVFLAEGVVASVVRSADDCELLIRRQGQNADLVAEFVARIFERFGVDDDFIRAGRRITRNEYIRVGVAVYPVGCERLSAQDLAVGADYLRVAPHRCGDAFHPGDRLDLVGGSGRDL